MRPLRWYVRGALRARSVAALCLVAVAGCGGGERQDENEPEGSYPVEVVRATFPENQKLAKSSNLLVTVRNAGQETIPNIALTVNGLDERKDDPDLADPTRPVFALNGVQVQIAGFPEAKDASPRGCDTAYVNTWACGPLRPNEQRTFRWSVTAVRAGDFSVNWRLAELAPLVARAAPHGEARVLREAVVCLVPQAHREDAAAAAPHDLLVHAAVAEACLHGRKASTKAGKGSSGQSRSFCPMC